MATRLVVFDCDGVLFESEEANIAFYDRVLTNAGVPAVDWRGLQAMRELASANLFERYFGERPEMLAAVKEAAATTDYGPFFSLMRPRPGMRETLELVHARFHTALATNRSRTLTGVIEHFGLASFFDLAVGASDVERPKPDPDMILKCIAHLEVSADETVYVGDQEIDREAAGRAGTGFLATGPHFAGRDFHMEELSELPRLLSGTGVGEDSGQAVEVVDQEP